MEESSASEGDHSRGSLDQSGEQDSRTFEDRGDRPLGIKSSWNGGSSFKDRHSKQKSKEEPESSKSKRQNSDGDESAKMVDVGLESTVLDNEVPEDLLQETQTPTDT